MARGLCLVLAGELGSPHFRRWCNQLRDADLDVRLVHTGAAPPASLAGYEDCVLYLPRIPADAPDHALGMFGGWGRRPWWTPRGFLYRALRLLGLVPSGRSTLWLSLLLLFLRPRLVHSHGLNVNWQNHLLPVRKALSRLPASRRPPWIYSSWGTDLDFFPRFRKDQAQGIQDTLPHVDVLVTECDRDRDLAREFGFRGLFWGKLPMFGGMTESELSLPQAPAAARRLILVKGRDNTLPLEKGGDPVGRARFALDALESLGDRLKGWRVVVLQASPSIRPRAKALAAGGMDIRAPGRLSYEKVLALYAQARIFMAVTVNDGLPSSLCEAFGLGAFPIYSDLPSVAEWIRPGENGFLIPADDPQAIKDALSRAMEDDALVTAAAVYNRELVRQRLEYGAVRQRVLALYHDVAALRRNP
ncbi:glycosyl transferase group 1 [Solidesulfovibrio fructosivorans JJ]]|uniref:Glycosyl transferase group 1 n=1 Tax=Solidesulfovibrio fructosivorans JJ] TaxID=596151 RepID=E1JXP3_SOLFR|nr:glycosyltransferase family 4 protein [Solidesulfovibrio fructosivorans]EFL50816.1 glycosyl transferase group 1 [Solidesulfovibrio fructosivorans JJ]]